ncbi:hypothetical protein Ahia01_000808300 [Argonauta hians]
MDNTCYYFQHSKVPQRLDKLEFITGRLKRKFDTIEERVIDISQYMDLYIDKIRELNQLTSLLIILKSGNEESLQLMNYLLTFFTAISNQMKEKDESMKQDYSLFTLRHDEKTQKLMADVLDILGFTSECINILKLSLNIVHEDDWRRRKQGLNTFDSVKNPQKVYNYLRSTHADVEREIQFTLQKMIAIVYFEALFAHIADNSTSFETTPENSNDGSEHSSTNSQNSDSEFELNSHLHCSLGNTYKQREDEVIFHDLLSDIKTSVKKMRAQKLFKLK